MGLEMTEEPQSAADPRPGGKPYYEDEECEDCGTEIIYYHEAFPEKYDEDDEYWYDEFWCPECEGGIILDWPKDYKEKKFEEWSKHVEEMETVPLEEMEEKLDLEE